MEKEDKQLQVHRLQCDEPDIEAESTVSDPIPRGISREGTRFAIGTCSVGEGISPVQDKLGVGK